MHVLVVTDDPLLALRDSNALVAGRSPFGSEISLGVDAPRYGASLDRGVMRSMQLGLWAEQDRRGEGTGRTGASTEEGKTQPRW